MSNGSWIIILWLRVAIIPISLPSNGDEVVLERIASGNFHKPCASGTPRRNIQSERKPRIIW